LTGWERGRDLAKRKIDTGLWPKRWFRELSPVDKVGWFYVLTNCDAVGVWDADLKLANFCIGAEVDWAGLQLAANGNIEVLDSGKWWIVDFCLFQYGRIPKDPHSDAHKNIVAILVRHGLWDRYLSFFADSGGDRGGESGLTEGVIEGVDKAKAKAKAKAKEEERRAYAEDVSLKPSSYSELVGLYGERVANLAIDKVSAQQVKTGKKYPNPLGAIKQWGIRAALEELRKSKGDGIDRSPAKHPPCDVCGKECVRGVGGYWDCPEHGRRESVS
jgi:hypothetical protein